MADDTLFIPVVLGTARTNRKSEHAARFICAELEKRDNVQTQLVDVRDHIYEATTPPWGEGGANENPTEWKQIAERADGYCIVSPEYNHGYPGELKQLLDSLYDEYKHKPVAVCGVSKGSWGGTRFVEHIKPVLIEFSMVPTRNAGYFPKIEEAFDEEGNPTDSNMGERYENMLEELFSLSRILKNMRS